MGQFKMPKDARKLDWQVTMQRISGIPLDMSSVFSTADEALKYVKGEKKDVGVPYIGQIITVTAEKDDPKTYCINILGATGDGKEELTDYCTELGAGSGADVTLDSEIKVEGGPLADLLTKNEITTISAGTTFEEFVSLLVRQKKFPAYSYASQSASVSLSAPSITIRKGDASGDVLDNKSVCEVGTPIYVDSVSAKTASYSYTPQKFINLTYGYSKTIDGENIPGPTLEATSGVSLSGNYKLSFSSSGYTNVELPSDVTGSTPSNIISSGKTFGCVGEGDNKITVTEAVPTYTFTSNEIEEYFVTPNFGDRDKNKTISHESVTTGKTTTQTATHNVVGKYKYFIGCFETNNIENIDSDGIRGLNLKTDFLEITGNTNVTVEKEIITTEKAKSIVIAFPKNYELVTITNSFGLSLLDEFEIKTTKNVLTGSVQTEYNVYIFPVKNDNSYELTNIVIKSNNA